MPLIELEPPRVRPRGTGMLRLLAFGSGSVAKFQLYTGLFSSLVNPAGRLIHIDLSGGPASDRSTGGLWSSVRRFARPPPAQPAPTMIWSYSAMGVPLCPTVA